MGMFSFLGNLFVKAPIEGAGELVKAGVETAAKAPAMGLEALFARLAGDDEQAKGWAETIAAAPKMMTDVGAKVCSIPVDAVTHGLNNGVTNLCNSLDGPASGVC